MAKDGSKSDVAGGLVFVGSLMIGIGLGIYFVQVAVGLATFSALPSYTYLQRKIYTYPSMGKLGNQGDVHGTFPCPDELNSNEPDNRSQAGIEQPNAYAPALHSYFQVARPNAL